MRISQLFFALMSLIPAVSVGNTFTEGILFVNEGQYGKGNGTLNYLLPDNGGEWRYRVFRDVNPGKELGCTPSFGTYHDGRLYVVSKLPRDPGSAVTGGVLTVADGATLECVGQIDALDASGARACGRAFAGIDAGKGYVSSSNGIWVVDLAELKVTGRIEGSENPYGTDSKPIGDPTSAIYFGQCGSMVKCGGRVFAAHQSKGILVIDAATDRITETIAMDCVAPGAGVGSLVKSADGSVWASVTENVDGDGVMLGKLLRIAPSTLETTVVSLPSGCYPPTSSWAAWTSDTFCASTEGNQLFWTGGSSNWFANQLVFRYDIDSGTSACIISYEDDDDMWKVCGSSLRVNPADGNLFVTLFKDVSSTQYLVRRYSRNGVLLDDYPMMRGYWFPGEILFPATQLAGLDAVSADGGNQKCSVSYHDGALTVKGPREMVDGTVAAVYDSRGCKVAVVTLSYGNPVGIALHPGLYILSTPTGMSGKFMVK